MSIDHVICPRCKAENCHNNSTCIKCDGPMPGDEWRLNRQIAEVWNKFVQFSPLHPDDQNEFRAHIHALQNILASRACVKLGLLGMVQKYSPTDLGKIETEEISDDMRKYGRDFPD